MEDRAHVTPCSSYSVTMANSEARSLCQDVEALAKSHPQAPAQDLIALVMQGRASQVFHFDDPFVEHGSLASPRSAFGQVLAAAFDRVAPPGEWMAFTGPDAHPLVVKGMLEIWQEQVISRFEAAYGVQCKGLPAMP